MEQHFATEHKQATGKDIEKGGYPDMGSGRYSAKLNYEQWFRFNNAQRAHMNFIEFAPSTFVLLFIAGIYFPVASAAIGLAIIIARIAYSIGYTNGGPAGRVIGAIVNDFALLGLLGLSFASGIFFIQGK
jgi:glutathione S-transferase